MARPPVAPEAVPDHPRRRRGWVVTVAAVGVIAGALVVPTATADPRPTIAEVQARLDQLDLQVTDAAEAMNAATARLDDLQRSLASLRAKERTQRAAYARVALGLGQLASAVYRGGGIDADLAVLLADDPSSFLAQAAALEQVAAGQNAVLRRTATARLALATTEARVAQEQAAADAARAEAAAHQADIDARLREEQQLLSSLQAEQRARLLAQQRAERAAARAAAAQAEREAAARAAADRASRATRPAPVTAVPATDPAPVAPAPAPVVPVPAPAPTRTTAPAPRPAPRPAPTRSPAPAPVAAPAPVVGSDRADVAVQAALSKVGNDYVAGGRGPSVFDCSGLTSWAWRQAGVSLVAYSYTQFDQTRRVSRSEARPGDLVFFFGSGAHHVGLYLGGGQMVHAANPSRGVIISSIDGPWYGERFSGFGRVVG